jgi:hypothetical protein
MAVFTIEVICCCRSHLLIRHYRRTESLVFFQSVMLFLNYLKSNNLLGAWAFFGLADFEFNSLAIA